MRNRKSFHESEETTNINISPLIDMVFILLIFFIVTTVFVEEEGLVASTPDPSDTPRDMDKELVNFLIRANGAVVYDGKEIGVGGVQAVVRPAMRNEVTPITVNVESAAPMDTVVSVMDEAYRGGAEHVTMKEVQTR